jgi:hypothetical protein
MVRWWRRENPRRVGLKSGQSSWTKAIDFLGQIFSLPTKTHHHLVQTPSHVPPAQSPIKKSYYSVSTQIKLNHSRRARARRRRALPSPASTTLWAAAAREILKSLSPETRRIARTPRLRCPARPPGSGRFRALKAPPFLKFADLFIPL